MMLLCGQVNRIWHYWAGLHAANPVKYPTGIGVLIGPSYGQRVPIDEWMPFVLDNDAFKSWKEKTPWSESAWLEMLDWIDLTRQTPLWAAVPDVVTNREATLANWPIYGPIIKQRGWNAAFCVQDGMTPDDVPSDADVVFVGGSDGWKFPNLKQWTDNFPRVHCARVASEMMLNACDKLGCESVDSTAWFRAPDRADRLPMLKRFIEGHRDNHPELALVKA